jgi:hypothetical protein
MTPADKELKYWQETVPEYAEHIFSILTKDGFDKFNKISIDYRDDVTVLSEKPDFIDSSLWHELFVDNQKYSSIIKNNKALRIYFLEIEGINIGLLRSASGYHNFVCFTINRSSNITYGEVNISVRKKYYLDELKFKTERFTRSYVKKLYNACAEVYGEDNTMIALGTLSSNLAVLTNITLGITVLHPEFWVADGFGIKMFIKKGISFFNIGDNSRITNIQFSDLQTDGYSIDRGFCHPHVKPSELCYKIPHRVCLGSGSPINTALSSFVSESTEENALNILYNYNNLLSQEDEQGGPHVRMRFTLSTSVESISYLSGSELRTALKEGEISVGVNISPDDIDVIIKRDSISEYIERKYSVENSNRYFLREFFGIFDFDISGRRKASPYKEGVIHFKGKEIDVEISEHDPSRFDFTGIKDNPAWSCVTKNNPPFSEIIKQQKQIKSIVNNHILETCNITPINYAQTYPEELLGIKKITRGASSNRLTKTATAN